MVMHHNKPFSSLPHRCNSPPSPQLSSLSALPSQLMRFLRGRSVATHEEGSALLTDCFLSRNYLDGQHHKGASGVKPRGVLVKEEDDGSWMMLIRCVALVSIVFVFPARSWGGRSLTLSECRVSLGGRRGSIGWGRSCGGGCSCGAANGVAHMDL